MLSSQSIPSQLVRSGEGWQVCVETPEAERARKVLAAYDLDTAEDRCTPRPPSTYGSNGLGAALAALLCVAFVATGTAEHASASFRSGTAVSDRILAGEWWRTATALTLHADLPHLLANAASIAIFGTAVAWTLGPGVGAILILAGGMLGNAASAAAYGGGHVSVGGSTSVFAALGILCGQQFVYRRSLRSGSKPAWLALAAGLALLAFLGTSERSDMGAHAFGLGAGTILGALTALAFARPPGAATQLVTAVASATLLGVAWITAISAPS